MCQKPMGPQPHQQALFSPGKAVGKIEATSVAVATLKASKFKSKTLLFLSSSEKTKPTRTK